MPVRIWCIFIGGLVLVMSGLTVQGHSRPANRMVMNSGLSQSEHDALMQIYTELGGDDWIDNTGWGGPLGTEGSWFGLVVIDGHVTEIHLADNNLTGTLSEAVGAFSSLIVLDLEYNRISGSLPAGLCSLSNIQKINLWDNEITGSIPPAMGGLASLQWLAIGGNQLSGTIPPELGNLSNLQMLDLGHNHLTGEIPSSFGALENINYLGLLENELSGRIPPEIGNLSILYYLELGNNQLSGSIPMEIGNLVRLNGLGLGCNRLIGSVPKQIGNLVNLEYLHIESNNLSGEWPAEILNLVRLEDRYHTASDFRWNALHTTNQAVSDFLDSKQYGGNWETTQTIPPHDVVAIQEPGTLRIRISWTPISYVADPGYYRVYYSLTPDGPFRIWSGTNTKSESFVLSSDDYPPTDYYFFVTTTTYPNLYNDNWIESEPSPVASVHIRRLGDLDGTNTVQAPDLVIMAGFLAGMVPSVPPAAADIDGDGLIGASDLSCLINILNGQTN